MLSDGAVKYLQPLRYDPNAERRSSTIPMGGIYWADEIPDFHALMDVPKHDRDVIYRLFTIRFKLWAGEDSTTTSNPIGMRLAHRFLIIRSFIAFTSQMTIGRQKPRRNKMRLPDSRCYSPTRMRSRSTTMGVTP